MGRAQVNGLGHFSRPMGTRFCIGGLPCLPQACCRRAGKGERLAFHRLHAENFASGRFCCGNGGIESDGVSELRFLKQFPLTDPAMPVGAATSITDGETGLSGDGLFRRKNGGDSNRLAASDEGGSLRGGDSDPRAAVAAGASTDEHRLEAIAAMFSEEFGKRFEKKGVMPAVADEGFFPGDFLVDYDGDGSRLGGSFDDKHGGHSGISGFGHRTSRKKLSV